MSSPEPEPALALEPERLKGPLRVLAAPGAGKTEALVSLYASLAREGVPRSRILVLTFSSAAAGELRRRVDQRLLDSYDEDWISTFHGFCWRILGEHSPDPRRLLLSGFQEWLTMRRVLSAMDPAALGQLAAVRDSETFAEDALGFVALLKQNLIRPEPFALQAEAGGSPRLRALAATYSAYQARLETAHLADFRDLVAGAIGLLQSRQTLRDTLRARFSHVLVDEFQDVDPAQFALLRLLAPPEASPRLVVVGDPDQSIYGFRGSVPSLLIRDFETDYGPQSLRLDTSRRCPAEVLAAGERLLEATQTERPPRRLLSLGRQEAAVDVAWEADAVDEAFHVARRIKEHLLESGGDLRPRDFAILLRSTSELAAPFEQALQALGLPCEVRGLAGLGRNETVRYLLAYLRALARPEDPDALAILLGTGLAGSRRLLSRLRAQATDEGRPLGKVVNRLVYLLAERDPVRYPLPWPGDPVPRETGTAPLEPGYLAFVEEAELDRFHAAVTTFHRLRKSARRLPVASVAYSVLIEAGVLARLLSPELDEPQRARRLAELRAALEAFEQVDQIWPRLGDRPAMLEDCVEDLEAIVARAVNEVEAAPREQDAVQVLTVHQAKGLEFEVVFLSGFAEGIFPVRARPHPLLEEADRAWLESVPDGFRPAWATDSQGHLAEEARLAYVAMTRARRWLHVTYATEYHEKTGPSPFVELALPGTATLGEERAPGELDPHQILTVAEAETVCALHAAALDEPTARRLCDLGCDLDFVRDPSSGLTFAPYLGTRPEGVSPHHFSATELTAYLKCPRLYWYSHHPGLVAQPRTPEMTRGGFLHKVLEDFHSREPEWRYLQLPDQRSWLEGVLQSHLDIYLGRVEATLDRRREELEVRKILANYLRFATSLQKVPRRGTLAIEKRFRLQLDGAEIHGVIDRINDTGFGTCEVVDYKTGRGMPVTRAYQAYFGPQLYDVQLAIYYLACREGVDEEGVPLGLEPRFLSLWYPKDLVYGSMRQVLFAVGEPAGLKAWMESQLSAEDLARARSTVTGAIERIREGDFEPRPREASGTCLSFTGCPHQGICPFARSGAE